jgi:leucyl/phenylalanyl-tRNA---protein transferase
VIEACSQRTDGDDTWISDEIIEAYVTLHEKGFAHSFEVWQNNELVGGLYGVSIGKAFFGESMFYRVKDASKIALVFLVEFLREHQFQLLDTQYLNPHLLQFGAYEISHDAYMEMLDKAVRDSRKF